MQSEAERFLGAAQNTRRYASRPLILRGKNVSSSLENADYRAYWEGMLFIDGILSGETSVAAFFDELKKTPIEDACRLLKGIYFIVVESKKKGEIHAFVDNAGLYHAFYTDCAVSNSFLELARHEGYGPDDLSAESVAEFLHFGCLFFQKTYFDGIRRIARTDVLCLPEDGGKMKFLRKKGIDLDAAPCLPPESIWEYFRKLALSLGNCNVSVDLTGGTDTRLVAAMLDHFGLEFETGSSGGDDDYVDISVARKVAGAMGHRCFGTIHSLSSLERDIRDVFYATEGLYDALYYHRLFQLQNARKNRGIDTMISGVGGELFKDFWWLQDFPFYSRKSANIGRFVNMRLMPFEPMSGILAGPFAVASRGLKGNLKRGLSCYVLDSNTRTYDNIFYNVILADIAGRILTSHSNYLKCFAPFLDLDLARMGFNLKLSQRCFNLFHRKVLTRVNPLLARFATSENGMTVSCEPGNMLRDLPRFFNDRLRRLLIKLGMLKQRKFRTLNNPDFIARARPMKVTKASISALKDAGIIAGNVQLSRIEDKYLGMFLSLGMLIRDLW
ncbi:MAG: asparagine synthase-related protein [Nitrospiraceae bacterium]|nr:asparagine synthase-related protein [Nitrospiraceae bacterium]